MTHPRQTFLTLEEMNHIKDWILCFTVNPWFVCIRPRSVLSNIKNQLLPERMTIFKAQLVKFVNYLTQELEKVTPMQRDALFQSVEQRYSLYVTFQHSDCKPDNLYRLEAYIYNYFRGNKISPNEFWINDFIKSISLEGYKITEDEITIDELYSKEVTEKEIIDLDTTLFDIPFDECPNLFNEINGIDATDIPPTSISPPSNEPIPSNTTGNKNTELRNFLNLKLGQFKLEKKNFSQSTTNSSTEENPEIDNHHKRQKSGGST